jgi:hypothetical protein
VSALIAVLLGAGAVATTVPAPSPGITLTGESDTALGLTLTPWQREAPSDLDRPPALFDMPLHPADADAFARQVEFDESRARAVRERLQRR